MQPLIDFKYEVIESRLNSMFELATIDEIDKLRTQEEGGSGKSSDSLQLDDLEVELVLQRCWASCSTLIGRGPLRLCSDWLVFC